jgi:serine phosphatase RsbU (regulator of sigma subunit)
VLGVVKVADMVNKLVEVQAKLIDTMQQSGGRLQEEVANAASLQNNLLRPAQIDLPCVRGLATLITSSEIGGDFYDYYVVDERWVVMLVGDVSGHGVAAGTMVSAAKAGVNLLETDREKEPAKILERLNHSFIHTAHQSLLMTMLVVCLDTQTNELRYANAGHQFPYIYRAVTGCLEMLELGGNPLGANEAANYKQQTTEMEIAARFFIYTDGIIEEENDQGDCFGYERLEEILIRYAESDLAVVRDRLLEALSAFVDRYNFSDDVTLFYVEYYERQRKSFSSAQSLTVESYLQDFELIRVIDSFYRNNQQAIPPHIARQNIAFLAEANFADLVPSLAAQGIRRILVRHHTINRQLGWNNMLKQHQYRHTNDLAMYLPQPRQQWQFQINHSDDKDFILEEVDAWLQGMELPDPVRVDAVVLLLDELIENGLYAAPRDGKNIPLYSKGTARKLLDHEMLELTLVIQNDILGISVTDNWGTLTPCVFLNRLSRDVRGPILDSGVGGGGLYFIWRMSDYLQFRVFPHHQTQVCAFLYLKTTFEPETDKSFQFFYHTEIHEESDYEQSNITTLS